MDAEVERQRFRTHSPELSLLLWAVWDPIGAGVPLDEYDNYVPGIWKLLRAHAEVAEVAAELTRIGEEQIGVEGATSQGAAERLKDWWYWRFDFPEGLERG